MILGGLRSQAWELFPGPKSVGQAWGTSLPLPHPVGGGGRALGGTDRACQPPRVAPWGRGPSSRSPGVYRHCQPYPLGLVSLGGPRARGLQPPSPHFHLMLTDSA